MKLSVPDRLLQELPVYAVMGYCVRQQLLVAQHPVAKILRCTGMIILRGPGYVAENKQ